MFWDRGYQAASISAFTEAMGIGSPSLYAAFGSKAKLFIEATDLHLTEHAGEPTRLLAGGDTARAAVEAMLRSNAGLFTRDGPSVGVCTARGGGHDTGAMGFNPFRQTRRSPADYVMVAAALVVCVALVAWALVG